MPNHWKKKKKKIFSQNCDYLSHTRCGLIRILQRLKGEHHYDA